MRGTRYGLLRLEFIRGELHRREAACSASSRSAEKLDAGTDDPQFLVARAWHRTGEYEDSVIDALRALVAREAEGRLRGEATVSDSAPRGEAVTSSRSAQGLRGGDRRRKERGRPRTKTDWICAYKSPSACMEIGGRVEHGAARPSCVGEFDQQVRRNRPEARGSRTPSSTSKRSASPGKGRTAESKLKRVFENNGEVEDALLLMYRSRSFQHVPRRRKDRGLPRPARSPSIRTACRRSISAREAV